MLVDVENREVLVLLALVPVIAEALAETTVEVPVGLTAGGAPPVPPAPAVPTAAELDDIVALCPDPELALIRPWLWAVAEEDSVVGATEVRVWLVCAPLEVIGTVKLIIEPRSPVLVVDVVLPGGGTALLGFADVVREDSDVVGFGPVDPEVTVTAEGEPDEPVAKVEPDAGATTEKELDAEVGTTADDEPIDVCKADDPEAKVDEAIAGEEPTGGVEVKLEATTEEKPEEPVGGEFVADAELGGELEATTEEEFRGIPVAELEAKVETAADGVFVGVSMGGLEVEVEGTAEEEPMKGMPVAEAELEAEVEPAADKPAGGESVAVAEPEAAVKAAADDEMTGGEADSKTEAGATAVEEELTEGGESVAVFELAPELLDVGDGLTTTSVLVEGTTITEGACPSPSPVALVLALVGGGGEVVVVAVLADVSVGVGVAPID